MSEFWITPDRTIYCDGDAGIDVPNHTSIVISECLSQTLDAMEVSDNDAVCELASHLRQVQEDCGDIVDTPMLSEVLNNVSDNMNRDGALTDEEADDIRGFIMSHIELDEWIVDIALGGGDYDERAFAMEKWGWVRAVCRRKCITLQMHRLEAGLLIAAYDAMHEEFDNDSIYDDIKLMQWDIEWVGGWVSQVSSPLVESGDVKGIRAILRGVAV